MRLVLNKLKAPFTSIGIEITKYAFLNHTIYKSFKILHICKTAIFIKSINLSQFLNNVQLQ